MLALGPIKKYSYSLRDPCEDHGIMCIFTSPNSVSPYMNPKYFIHASTLLLGGDR
jgi:hypothetical protein